MKKALVVDDSAIMRRIVRRFLAQEGGFETFEAADGSIALEAQRAWKPDLVILDVEMPGMDGLEALTRLRIEAPGLPIIILSALTGEGARSTLNALALGASDFIPKHIQKPDEGIADFLRRELLPKALALVRRDIRPHIATKLECRLRPRNIEAVAVALSTGGPNALERLLGGLGNSFPAPILIVQHLPAEMTRILAERLDAKCDIQVCEGKEGDRIQTGRAYIAPGGFHMALADSEAGSVLRLNRDPPENSCRPSADLLFRSAASVFGPNLLAVVMTGMGHDGLKGCMDVKRRGGHVVVQNEASSVVWGMPGSVAAAGLADEILPLDEISPALIQMAARGKRS